MTIWKRSETNDFTKQGGMTEKDHILRLARGALMDDLTLEQFIELALKPYVDGNDTTLDDQPLCGWWYMGGA